MTYVGAGNYTSDGIDPETGTIASTFTFRATYTDLDNNAPDTGSGYPRVVIKKGGSAIAGSPFTMTGLDGDSTYNDGKIYTTGVTGLSIGSNYTYQFEANDSLSGAATGAATLTLGSPVITNTVPALAYVGTGNYVADGVDPENGTISSTFTFRVNYTDLDNHAPDTGSGYPRVVIKKGGTGIAGSPFTMTGLDGDVTYSDGKVYTTGVTGLSIGADYTYQFEANDSLSGVATGAATLTLGSPTITNALPALTYPTGGICIGDGLDPEIGTVATSFTFRVNYTDLDNQAPLANYPKVSILKGGSAIAGSPFTMTGLDGDATYNDGKTYTTNVTGLTVGSDYTYAFQGYDSLSGAATGAAISSLTSPSIGNTAPTLGWEGSANYTNTGLYPEMGTASTAYTYKVVYGDQDNQTPAPGYPKVYIMNVYGAVSGSPFTMTESVPGDTTYSDGKLYEFAKNDLVKATAYTYYFVAKDIQNTDATGAPLTPKSGPEIANLAPTLDWTGDAGYILDGLEPHSGDLNTDFVFKVKYQDLDNEAPFASNPVLHIKKGGQTFSAIVMTEVNAGDTTYSDGKLYSCTTKLISAGSDYTYYVTTKDIPGATGTSAATTASTPTTETAGLTISGQATENVTNSVDTTLTVSTLAVITIPAGALSGATVVTVIPVSSYDNSVASRTHKGTNIGLEIKLASGETTLSKNITIIINYSAADVADLDEAKLRIFYYSDTLGQWVLIKNSVVDAANNKVTCNVNHLTIFRIMEYTGAVDPIETAGNYPNPFNPAVEKTRITYNLKDSTDVKFIIYDLLGGKVYETDLAAGTSGAVAGPCFFDWDGKNFAGDTVSAGMYICRITTEGKTVVRRIGVKK